MAAAAPSPLALPQGFVGATPPELPATMSRDADGRTTVRVVRLSAPLKVDGNLEEDLYRTIQPISDFIQVEPRAGTPATEKSEVWLSFDDQNLYVSVRASESAPERLVVNEIAPRVHNSGHWTIDACVTSQFEQVVRAICGLPLGNPRRHSDAVMDNLIGDAVNRWPEIVKEPDAKLHLYGKSEARPGRKMGHVTRLSPRRDRDAN